MVVSHPPAMAADQTRPTQWTAASTRPRRASSLTRIGPGGAPGPTHSCSADWLDCGVAVADQVPLHQPQFHLR